MTNMDLLSWDAKSNHAWRRLGHVTGNPPITAATKKINEFFQRKILIQTKNEKCIFGCVFLNSKHSRSPPGRGSTGPMASSPPTPSYESSYCRLEVRTAFKHMQHGATGKLRFETEKTKTERGLELKQKCTKQLRGLRWEWEYDARKFEVVEKGRECG